MQGVADADNYLGTRIAQAFAALRRFIARFDSKAEPLARAAVKRVNTNNEKDFVSSFKKGAGVDVSKIQDPSARNRRKSKIPGFNTSKLMNQLVPRTFERAVAENVRLIKTIAPQYLDKVEAALYSNMREGASGQNLKQVVMELNGQNERRALTIARDQIQKFNSELSKARQESLGISGYVWRTSRDERVRSAHAKLNGKRFSWEAPPSEGHPGEAINCRCTAEPDLTSILPWKADEF